MTNSQGQGREDLGNSPSTAQPANRERDSDRQHRGNDKRSSKASETQLSPSEGVLGVCCSSRLPPGMPRLGNYSSRGVIRQSVRRLSSQIASLALYQGAVESVSEASVSLTTST